MRLSLALQYLAPHRLLSWIVRRATRWTFAPWKDFLISSVIRRYGVDLREALEPDPRAYRDFNAFFTRALKPDARPIADDPKAILSPADGRVSHAGRIGAGRIVQAKGRDYGVDELLADADAAAPYRDGAFLTVYLSPRDYHRVHLPIGGRLVRTLHVPGRLFSVAPEPVATIPRLFARNERLVCHFESADGPFAVVLVGAMLVSGISTVWAGAVVPPYARRIRVEDFRDRTIELSRGAELGRFEMGSTVVVLLPERLGTFAPELVPEQAVKVRETVGRLR